MNKKAIEFDSNAIIIFFNFIAIIAKLEFTYKHIGKINEKYMVGSIVLLVKTAFLHGFNKKLNMKSKKYNILWRTMSLKLIELKECIKKCF